MDSALKVVFLSGFVVVTVIRGWYARRHPKDAIADSRKEGLAMWSLMSLWGATQLIAMVYVLTPWLDVADYHLPTFAGLVGATTYVVALGLLWRSHVDLGRNWSAMLEIRKEHTLVTQGTYRTVRHPMYAAHWLWVIAQPLLLQNWIAGPPALAVFLLLYLLRAPREEQMMLDRFGAQYRLYMNRTGRVIPRLWSKSSDA